MAVPRDDRRGIGMIGERWQQVKQLLDEAIALDVSERDVFLDRRCAADTDLRREVESLLSSHEQAGTGFLKTPAVDLKTAAAASPARDGRRIGVYRIIEEIGHGGMGEVYRAVRADGQFTKEVAIKLVRGGFDTGSLVERFRNERQILASLDHPNIARLLDGGTTEEGIPYLVMELVEGVRVDSYCDVQKLSITERLQLFRQICAAVQYAHQRLVIHRDIKPSNILVTKDGAPKLLDFGIAKLLDPASCAETTMARPMTPEYASPEQIRGESITTASDVYSLGVVLYQLLTGRSPYLGETRTPHELARAVCETEPGRPSTAVLKPLAIRSGEQVEQLSPEEISSSREVSPAKLGRRLSGDLDNITLMALRKEASRRYASVEQFAEDIRRHLEGLPVIATKGSWRYMAGKFVRRQRAAVAATGAVLLVLVGGIAATVREARIARKQAAIASAERARAERRFNDVRQLSDSLIFDIHDAIQNLPGATPARKLLLDRAVEYLDSVSKDAGGDPDLQRELAWGYQRLAVVQGNPTESNLGDLTAALASDRKGLALFEAVAKANPANDIDQLNVAMMHRILSYSEIGEASGRQDLEQAMAISDRLLKKGSTDPKVRSERSIEYQNLALMRDASGERAQALEAYKENLALKLDILRTNPDYRKIRRGVGNATILLGAAMGRMGAREEALKTLNQGIADYEAVAKIRGNDDINTRRELAVAKQKRGDVLLMNGNIAAAQASFHEARQILEPMAKADPQNTLLQFDMAGIEYEESRVLVMSRRYAEAIAKLQHAARSYEGSSSRSADDSPRNSSDIYIWLGDALAGKGDLRESLQYFRKATAVLGTAPKLDDDMRCELATSYLKTGSVLARMGKLSDAFSAYRKGLEIADPSTAVERNDIPLLFVIAEGQAGMADVAAALAYKAHYPEERARLTEQSRTAHQQSLESRRHVPNPSRISPTGFLMEAR
jgi:eukaryotic-like serine/threonine-protein kinase